VRRHRELYRQKRRRNQTPVAALVGYTNAGKSTLFNALSRTNVIAENKPFSTLDPVTRRLTSPDGVTFLLTDTVGFIHKLPPSIIAAFRATLEELQEADLILHVVDVTHRNAADQYRTVEDILNDLGLKDKPRLLIINKIDIALRRPEDVLKLPPDLAQTESSEIFLVSALKGWYLDRLLNGIARRLRTASARVVVSHNVSFATRG
jgi:GTP-binding protein HflX